MQTLSTPDLPSLVVEVLGTLRLRSGDHVIEVPPSTASGLLALLAARPNRLYTREELGAMLWPDDTAEQVGNRLRQMLHRLRRLLEQPGLDAADALVSTRGGVRLDSARARTDVQEFEARLEEAARAPDPAGRIAALERAVALYRREPFAGLYLDELLHERARLAALHTGALLHLSTACAEAGDLDRAIRVANEAVAADPPAEEAHGQLMRLHSAAGMPSAVLRQYRELERALAAAVGEKPSEEIRGLMERLRDSARTQSVAPSPAADRSDGHSEQTDGPSDSAAAQTSRPADSRAGLTPGRREIPRDSGAGQTPGPPESGVGDKSGGADGAGDSSGAQSSIAAESRSEGVHGRTEDPRDSGSPAASVSESQSQADLADLYRELGESDAETALPRSARRPRRLALTAVALLAAAFLFGLGWQRWALDRKPGASRSPVGHTADGAGRPVQMAQDTDGIFAAIEADDVKRVKDYLDANISPNVQDKEGETAFSHAATDGKTELLIAMLPYHPDVNCTQGLGRFTPLMFATVNGHVDTVRALLKVPGIEKDKQDSIGQTALHKACREDAGHPASLATVKALVDGGVNQAILDKYGCTAYWHVTKDIEPLHIKHKLLASHILTPQPD